MRRDTLIASQTVTLAMVDTLENMAFCSERDRRDRCDAFEKCHAAKSEGSVT